MQKLSEQELNSFFDEYAKTRDISLRNIILEQYLYIAEIVAKKFTGRGVEYDDLFQVASLALVSAIERFEPTRGIKFQSFATTTLIGEVKNYFRDKTRMLHISRRDSEQLLKLQEAKQALSLKDKVMPTDIAEYMGVDAERVLELMEMQQAVSVVSLDASTGDEEDQQIGDFVGADDKGYAEIENMDFLKRSINRLSDVEKKILYARFWKKLSQKEVADSMGVSQMYVSRYEKKILEKLRSYSNED